MKSTLVAELTKIVFLAAFVVGAFGIFIYGLYLAFSASAVLGLISLLVEPSAFVFGLVYLVTGTNLAQQIVHYFR
jgi:hypothetical protein